MIGPPIQARDSPPSISPYAWATRSLPTSDGVIAPESCAEEGGEDAEGNRGRKQYQQHRAVQRRRQRNQQRQPSSTQVCEQHRAPAVPAIE